MIRPKSVTNMWFNVSGLLGFFVALFVLRNTELPYSIVIKTLFLILGTALPILFCELALGKTYENVSSGLKKEKNDFDFARISIKLIGLYGILFLIALIYFVFPEYNGEFYTPYYQLLQLIFPLVIILAPPYFAWVDLHMKDPNDSYWKFGMAILRKSEFTKEHLQLFLGWLVKAFFLPLMFVYFIRNINFLTSFNINSVFANFRNFYEFAYHLIFAWDLLFVCVGYMCTFRIFDSHIRTTEPTFLGWGCALLCYQPFWSFFSSNYVAYSSDKAWGYWFSESPWGYAFWGSCILFLLGVYVWATIAFGVRFSNLTNRGIITNGPYRFTKHPAYISKNIAWWMISMPFMISSNFSDTIRHCAMLFVLNFVYFLRAKTEERHLSQDPAYCEYKKYIEEHGLFAFSKENSKEIPTKTLDLAHRVSANAPT